MTWNINGVHTKLEKANVSNLLCNYDIICLNEVKTSQSISFSGCDTYVSIDKNSPYRGGTVVLIKNHLVALIISVDVNICDQIWIEIKSGPVLLFGFCYVPPSDSLYYSHEYFSFIQSKIKSNSCGSYFLIGDFNARFGGLVRQLPGRVNTGNSDIINLSYPSLPDDVVSPNDNACVFHTICVESGLLVINNLRTAFQHFASMKTFRRGGNWISEIDTCIASPNLVKYMNNFLVHQTDYLPSNHAPLSVSVRLPNLKRDWILSRAFLLGDHAVLHSAVAHSKITKKPVSFQKANK